MQLKITSPDSIIFDGDIEKITIPTELGELTIIPGNKPMVTALKPGIISFFTGKKNTNISIGKGMVFVDGKIVRIAVSSATTQKNNITELKKEKKLLEDKLKQIRLNGSLEDIEELQSKLAKINADIKLNS